MGMGGPGGDDGGSAGDGPHGGGRGGGRDDYRRPVPLIPPPPPPPPPRAAPPPRREAPPPPPESQNLDLYNEWAATPPKKRKVNKKDTVKYQIENLLDTESRYINQARQQGKEYASSRGLLNTSIAAGASERAAIEAALPIAAQDAQTYFTQGITNQNAENQFRFATKTAGLDAIVRSDLLGRQLAADWNTTMANLDFQHAQLGQQMAIAQLGATVSLAGSGASPDETYNIVHGGGDYGKAPADTPQGQIEQYSQTFNSQQYSTQRASSMNNYRRLYDEQGLGGSQRA